MIEAMIIGVLQFELLVHGSESLKDKRRVVKSLKDRLHREHLVSVAEVAALEKLNVAVMGLTVVGSDGKRVAQVLDKVQAKLRGLLDAELGAVSRQILAPDAEDLDPVEAEAERASAESDLASELLAYAEDEEPGP